MRCSCCSSNSISRLTVAGRPVQLLGLATLLAQYHDQATCPEELFRALRVYNAIPKNMEAEYRQAVMRAFAQYRPSDQRVAHSLASAPALE